MNLLPLVFSFILIFSYFSLSFFQEQRLVVSTDRSLKSAEHLESLLHNVRVRRQYAQITQAPSQPKALTTRKKNDFISRRTIEPPIEYAKLNLMPLMDPHLTDPHQHPLYPVAVALLHFLYAHTTAIPANEKEGWEGRLLDILIHEGRKKTTLRQLTDLTPHDPQSQKLYYTLLQGTQYYELSTTKGIPPLTSFMTLHTDKKENSIYFCFASPPLLLALFGEKIGQKILSHEKAEWETDHKYHLTSKEELESFIMQDPAAAQKFSRLNPYLNFQQKFSKKIALKAQDKTTGVALTRPLPK